MKTPIEPSDIRKGDLIRQERGKSEVSLNALEYRARGDGDKWTMFGNSEVVADYYLLDRPTPAVELPTEPTFGVLRWDLSGDGSDPCVREGRWFVRDGDVFQASANGTNTNTILAEDVDSFERVYVLPDATTAVPTWALDELRHYLSGWSEEDQYNTPAKRRIRYFLAAVDKAGEIA